MDIRDRRAIKSEAAGAIRNAPCNPQKLVFIHSGVMAVVMLLLSLIDFLLQERIAGTSGLGGLGTRSVLTTVQTVLEYISTVALPFWNMGYIFAALAMSRQENAEPVILLQGFRKFGPVLRLFLLENLLFLGLAVLCFYPSMILFLVTPLAAPLSAALEPLVGDGSVPDPAVLLENPTVRMAIVPLLVVFFVVYLFITIPLFYRFRMASFALADVPRAGAFAALRSSSRMMRGNRWALFRLDLSFWWFYLLEGIAAALCYGDVLLALIGIDLPISANVSYFLFYAIGLAGQTALYCWAKNHVTVTYAKVYEALRLPAVQKPAPIPRNQPWSY